eukprot:7938130-Alexandrium_andersonii.AAC.2
MRLGNCERSRCEQACGMRQETHTEGANAHCARRCEKTDRPRQPDANLLMAESARRLDVACLLYTSPSPRD